MYCFFFCVLFFIFLVNPIASSHFQNAQQQNLTSQNYSLHPNNNTTHLETMQMTSHYDASSFNSTSTTNNFNNFDPSNQFQYQQQQQSHYQQNYEGGHNLTQHQQMYQQAPQQQNQQQQFYGQSVMGASSATSIHQNHSQGINGPSTYQHTINDLLVQNSSSSYQQQPQQTQQNMYSNQMQSNQSVRKLMNF